MKLPNGDKAVVEERKLRDYVLNPLHPVGKHHAILFDRLLGIRLDNAHALKASLLRAASTQEVARETPTPYGRKYEIRFPLDGPRDRRMVLSVWIVEEGNDLPRLVTRYVE
jgi:hypothetical protein